MNPDNDDKNEQSANDKNNNVFEQETCDDMTDTFVSPTIDVLMPLFENDISFDFPDVEDQCVYEICSTSYKTPETEVNSTPAESFETTDLSKTQKETDTDTSKTKEDTDTSKTKEETDTSLTELSEEQTDEDIQFRQPRRRRKKR